MNGDQNGQQELEKFLLNIQCLDALREWSEKFNLFDMLRISQTEIRHSNMLAWLLDPKGNHGLGDGVLRRFIRELVQQEQAPLTQEEKFDALLMSLDDFAILREHQHTDILAVSQKEHFLVCIENKIFSKEHDSQLSRYYDEIKKAYPSYTCLFVYLTPSKDLPSEEEDQRFWQPIGYDEIIKIINEAKEGKTLAPDVDMVIRHYIESVERYVMGDKELEKRCREIYAKHKYALDLIFEYRDDNSRQVSEHIKAWCRKNKELLFDEDMATKGEIPFTTETMNGQLPPFPEPRSWWGDQNMYRYAFINRSGGQSLWLKLIVNRQGLTSEQIKRCEILADRIGGKKKSGEWTWWTLKSWKIDMPKMDPTEEEYQEQLFKKLDKVFEELKKKEKS